MKLAGGEGVVRWDPRELVGDPVLYIAERDFSTFPPESSVGVPHLARRGELLKLVPKLGHIDGGGSGWGWG